MVTINKHHSRENFQRSVNGSVSGHWTPTSVSYAPSITNLSTAEAQTSISSFEDTELPSGSDFVPSIRKENLNLKEKLGEGEFGESYLRQPTTSPSEIYDLMRECWKCDVNARPTFKEIHLFLHGKNSGSENCHKNINNAVASMIQV
uniref:Serine-threonine/tyrosine-protein kinase catalytic domain-containing protein n=1 Tax=Romanomermis culicivorax TaxID=13658 RepID=A0A915K9V6_ROMCU